MRCIFLALVSGSAFSFRTPVLPTARGRPLRVMDFRKLFGGGGGGSGALPPSVPLTFDTVGDTPAWGDIKAGLEATATGQALAKDKAAWEVGEGPAHNDAKLRLFGSTGEPRVTLFRDKAGWCPYCQKVGNATPECVRDRPATAPHNCGG